MLSALQFSLFGILAIAAPLPQTQGDITAVRESFPGFPILSSNAEKLSPSESFPGFPILPSNAEKLSPPEVFKSWREQAMKPMQATESSVSETAAKAAPGFFENAMTALSKFRLW
jgi:hypothetical protein